MISETGHAGSPKLRQWARFKAPNLYTPFGTARRGHRLDQLLLPDVVDFSSERLSVKSSGHLANFELMASWEEPIVCARRAAPNSQARLHRSPTNWDNWLVR